METDTETELERQTDRQTNGQRETETEREIENFDALENVTQEPSRTNLHPDVRYINTELWPLHPPRARAHTHPPTHTHTYTHIHTHAHSHICTQNAHSLIHIRSVSRTYIYSFIDSIVETFI